MHDIDIRPRRALVALAAAALLAACGDDGDPAAPGPDLCEPRPLTIGTALTGGIAAGDCDLGGGLLGDVYEVVATQPIQRMQFTATWAGRTAFTNGEMRLVDAATGATIAITGENSHNGEQSFVFALLPAGRYRLQLRAPVVGHTPTYSVTSTGGTADIRCENLWTRRGLTTTQQITFTDCWDGGGPIYSDWLMVRLAQGEQVQVTMRSTAFDAGLQIWSFDLGDEQSGDPLAVDQSGAGGTDARLVYTAPAAGTYHIRAHAGAPGQTGAYSLQIE